MQSTSLSNHNNSSFAVDGITITLNNAGKRFNRDWIFKKFSYTFQSGKAYAITGPNGSGKSTLLQCIAASTQLSEGTIEYRTRNKEEGRREQEIQQTLNSQLSTLNSDHIFQQLSIVAPYLEVIEEMTATEFLQFHSSFKPLLSSISIKEMLTVVGLEAAVNKQIRFYSSGMKQRVKLAQSIFSDVPILLLDEPCTNLDTTGYDLYHKLIADYCGNKLIIVSSNDKNEYHFCTEVISITDYK